MAREDGLWRAKSMASSSESTACDQAASCRPLALAATPWTELLSFQQREWLRLALQGFEPRDLSQIAPVPRREEL